MPPSHTRTTVDLAVAQKKFLRRVEGYALLALITDVACGTYALAMAERLITTDGSGPAAAAVHAFLLIALLAMPFGLHKAFTTGKVQPPSNKSTTSEWARFAGQLLIGQAVLVMLALILGLAAYAQASAAAGQYSQCMEEYYAAQNALYAQRTDQVPTNGCFKALSGSLELGGRVSRVAQLFVLVHMLLFAGYGRRWTGSNSPCSYKCNAIIHANIIITS